MKDMLRYKLCHFKTKQHYKREKKRTDAAQALKFMRKLGTKLRVPHKIRPKTGSFHSKGRKARKASDVSADDKISPRVLLL